MSVPHCACESQTGEQCKKKKGTSIFQNSLIVICELLSAIGCSGHSLKDCITVNTNSSPVVCEWTNAFNVLLGDVWFIQHVSDNYSLSLSEWTKCNMSSVSLIILSPYLNTLISSIHLAVSVRVNFSDSIYTHFKSKISYAL